jgi:hypothetical protein
MESKMNKIFFLFFMVLSPLVSAENKYCNNVNETRQLEQEIISPDRSGYKVVENGRLFFLVPQMKNARLEIFL